LINKQIRKISLLTTITFSLLFGIIWYFLPLELLIQKLPFPGRFSLPLIQGSLTAALLVISQIMISPTTKALGWLQRGIEEMTAGNYEFRLPSRKGWRGRLYSDFNQMSKNTHKKLTLTKYVSKSTQDMVDQLKTGEFSRKPTRKKATLFFSDIRGFTAYSEDHDPLDVISTINSIFQIQVNAINRNKGDIDKFIGDEIMALFPSPNHAYSAAKEIQKKLEEFNQNRYTPLLVGIGIHYGSAVMGAIGAGSSYDWTVVGDVVNSAKRICSETPGGQIFISGDAYKSLRNKKNLKPKNLKLKGKKAAVQVYQYYEG